MGSRRIRKPKPAGTRHNDRTALLVLLFAGVEKYRELFHCDPPPDVIHLVEQTRHSLGLFY